MTLTIPTELKEIKLAQVQRYWTIENNTKISDEMKWIHAVAVFSGKSVSDLLEVKISDVQKVYLQIAELVLPESTAGKDPLIPFFEFAQVKYGFEPDLREIETGAFVDLDEYVKDLNLNLHKVMAILYRPVTVQTKKMYQTRSYVKERSWEREHRQKIFLREMPYSYVRGAVNFFLEAVKKHSSISGKGENSPEKKIPTSNPGDGTTSSTAAQKETSPEQKPSSKKESTKP